MRGLYTVHTKDGPVVCKARGVFRETDTKPIVGDDVRIRMAPDGDIGYIEEVEPRKNRLLRPPVANIDRVLLVSSRHSPQINYLLLDRFLVMCEKEHLHVEIIFSKSDLTPQAEQDELESVYGAIGYPVHFTSVIRKEGLETIKERLASGTTALAGPSGVGKSALLSALYPAFAFRTGPVSERTRHGRHTTRHIEITRIANDAYVLDTPGFQTLELDAMEEADLSHYFPEFPQRQCRFDNCLHHQEPGCAVKEKLAVGGIARHRYENYLILLEEAKKQRRY